MYKVGIIGDRSSVLGFKAVGLDVFPVEDVDEAKEVLQRIARSKVGATPEYAIIYITEKLGKDMIDEMGKYKEMLIPAIIPIPGMSGSYGIGMANLKKSVERAVGADILFNND